MNEAALVVCTSDINGTTIKRFDKNSEIPVEIPAYTLISASTR